MLLGEIHALLARMTKIGVVGSPIVVVSLSKHENVLATTERILENGSGTEVDIRVVARSLVGGRAVKVPNAQFGDVGDGFRQCLLKRSA